MGKVKIINNTIHSAKVFIFKKHGNKTAFLVLKEPEGIHGFVGGAEDEEDSSLFETAKREILEEVNLTEHSCFPVATTITYEFIHTDKKSPRYGKKGVLHAFYAEYNQKEPIVLDKELMSYTWMDENKVIQILEDSYPYPYLKTVFLEVAKIIRQAVAHR